MTTEATRAHVIRVASYNIRALKDDRSALVGLIRQMAPDVLLLQEVPRHPLSGHRIANLADEFGLTWFGGARFRMSTTLMTSLRLDVLEARHGRLPVRRFDEPRGYGTAIVRLPGHRPLVATSVHLSLRPDDRLAQGKLLAAMAARSAPTVLGGDLNEEPSGPVWGALRGELAEASADRPTYSAADPHQRIDGIFASGGLTSTTPDIGLDRAALAAATDHLPVVVDLDIATLAL